MFILKSQQREGILPDTEEGGQQSRRLEEGKPWITYTGHKINIRKCIKSCPCEKYINLISDWSTST